MLLEDTMKQATVKVRFTEDQTKERNYCTGTVIGNTTSHTIILTVAHLLRDVQEEDPRAYSPLLEVVFYGSNIPHQCSIKLLLRESEILILTVKKPNISPPKISFAPKTEWALKDLQSLKCFSHPGAREWRSSFGYVRCPEFMDANNPYDQNMIFFDHDLDLARGASGAGVLNEDGHHIVGLQSLRRYFETLSARPLILAINNAGDPTTEDVTVALSDLKLSMHDVAKVPYKPCAMKQAVHIKYIDRVIRNLISPKDEDLSLNELIETWVAKQ